MRLNLDWLPSTVRQWILQRALKKNAQTVEDLAPRIRNDKHFRKILMAAEPAYRRAVYDHLKPKLKFRPKPYFLLMK